MPTIRNPKYKVGNAALTEDKVRTIRRSLVEGVSTRELSKMFGVGLETVRRIGRGESWAWLPWMMDEVTPEKLKKGFQDTTEYQKGLAEFEASLKRQFQESQSAYAALFDNPRRFIGQRVLGRIIESRENQKASWLKPEGYWEKAWYVEDFESGNPPFPRDHFITGNGIEDTPAPSHNIIPPYEPYADEPEDDAGYQE